MEARRNFMQIGSLRIDPYKIYQWLPYSQLVCREEMARLVEESLSAPVNNSLVDRSCMVNFADFPSPIMPRYISNPRSGRLKCPWIRRIPYWWCTFLRSFSDTSGDLGCITITCQSIRVAVTPGRKVHLIARASKIYTIPMTPQF